MTEKKEQTIGGSNIRFVGGGFSNVGNKRTISMPPKQSISLIVATKEKLKELEEIGYMEIEAGFYDALKEGDKIIKREINGKEIKAKGNKKDKVEIEK